MTNFELWIDESGSFDADEVRVLNNGRTKNPSLVGGILIDTAVIDETSLANHFTASVAHATDIAHGKEAIVLGDLRFISQMGGRFVIFENKERVSLKTSRELYLRVFASGIVQLLNTLSSEYGDYSLNIFIARRFPGEDRLHMITKEEYLSYIHMYILSSKENGTYNLSGRPMIDLTIGKASNANSQGEYKLDFSDSVCNAYLTSHDGKKLIEETAGSYIFSINETTSANRIDTALKNMDFGSALMEYAKNYTKLSKTKVLDRIISAANKDSYRVVRAGLKNFVSRLCNYVYLESDFEINEAMLRHMISNVCEKMMLSDIPYANEVSFRLNLCLVDMYQREGDLVSVGKTLENLDIVASKLCGNIEYCLNQWQRIEQIALYRINTMDYDGAVSFLGEAITGFEALIDAFKKNDFLNTTLKPDSSEYLGDALCMKVYAELYIQNRDGMYEQASYDVDYALRQYKDEGALERNQQYKAHIEMSAGHFDEALKWLFSTVRIDRTLSLDDQCSYYLDWAGKEDRISRCYYLMYYTKIMTNSLLGGRSDIAGVMHENLNKRKDLISFIRNSAPQQIQNIVHNRNIPDSGHVDDVLKSVDPVPSNRLYHPMEVVCSMMAVYSFEKGIIKEGREWFSRAIAVCNQDVGYISMAFSKLRILAQMAHYENANRQRELIRDINITGRKLSEKQLPDNMHNMALKWKEASSGKDIGSDIEKCYELAKYYTY